MVWRPITMIILKLYSSGALKAVNSLKRVGNKVMTGIDNAGLKAGEAIGLNSKGPTFRFKPKTSQQLGRETIELKNKVMQLKGAAAEAALNPGGAVNKGVETAIKKPGTVLGTCSPIPGGTFIGMGLDSASHKAMPKLPALKNKTVAAYREKIAPSVEGATNAFMKAIPI